MKHFKVLLTDRIDKAGMETLERVAEIKLASSVSEDVLMREIEDADGIIVRVPAVVTRKVIDSAKKLKVIARFGVGIDNIDIAAASERGIPVTYTPGANTLAVAEYTVALMFALAKQITKADRALREHRWEMRLEYQGIELTGKTLGLVGLGVIGAEVARLSRAFNINTIYYDVIRKEDVEKSLQIEFVPLTQHDEKKGLRVPEKLLNAADFLSIHVPLIEKTRGLIGPREIESMKNGAFLINTSRGGTVDEKAMYNAIRDGKLAGAGLDVFEKEPPYDSPLLKLDNVIAGPHVAALAKDTAKRMSLWVAEDTVRVLTGEAPLHVANPQVLARKR
jgi:D-3-phosphoglycerate dehydrogenase